MKLFTVGPVACYPEVLDAMLGYNGWLKANAAQVVPPITLLDNTTQSLDETLAATAAWIRARLPG